LEACFARSVHLTEMRCRNSRDDLRLTKGALGIHS